MNEQKKGGFFSIGLVKGILGYVVGMVVGLALVTVLIFKLKDGRMSLADLKFRSLWALCPAIMPGKDYSSLLHTFHPMLQIMFPESIQRLCSSMVRHWHS